MDLAKPAKGSLEKLLLRPGRATRSRSLTTPSPRFMKILTAEQTRAIDRLTTDRFGIPSIILMETAGMRVVEALRERFDDLRELKIVVLCGKGNNGGDGFVVARHLIQKACHPLVFLFAEDSDVKGDARANLDILRALGCAPTIVGNPRQWSQHRVRLADTDVVVDALMGTGLRKPVEGLYRIVIDGMKPCFPRATIVSVDLPSGLSSNDSRPIGPAVQADLTVTFTAPKFCLVLPPAQAMAGEVVVADIGNPAELLDSDDLKVHVTVREDFSRVPGGRDDDSNKGDYGKVLVIAGSRGKSGAAAMAGQAALCSGAGLVTVASAGSVLPEIAASMPELMAEELPETAHGTIAMAALDGGRFDEVIRGKTVLGVGPGLTTHVETVEFTRHVVRQARVPTVLDADGLNAFVGHENELYGGDRPLIVTPHPGEMARLIGRDVGFIRQNRVDVARDFAAGHGVYVVLKGFRTVIALPDGRAFVNPTGNSGMATGGSGDVLTGMILGILGQEHLGSLANRLCLGVYLHGLAGDQAAEALGEEAMTATDIIAYLPEAWRALRGGNGI